MRIKDVQRERQTFIARLALGALGCILMLGALVARLLNVQVFQHDYYSTRADENRMRLTPVPPVRGLIYDRNGVLLAQNKPAFVLEVIPEKVEDIPATLERLGKFVSLSEKDLARFKDRVKKTPKYRGVPLRTNLSMEEVARFEVSRYDYRGVDVTAGLTRNYPVGASAAHVVGYVGGINEEELQKLDAERYQGLTQIGKTGAEKSQEELLRGEPGAKIIEANAHGRPLRELDYRLGAPGKNLYLTIDTQVQAVAEKALGTLNGAVVVLDPRNGEVLALVSQPGFDPQLFVEGIDVPTFRALNEDKKRPLFNRALQGQYPPGSTVKPAMAIAGLEHNLVNPNDREFCVGEMGLPNSTRKYRCHKRAGHGWMDMVGGVMQSCDIYFYALGLKLGIDRISTSMGEFGLGRQTGIDLPLEKSGLMPSRDWKRRARKENWYPGETLNTAIGQGYMLTTPLQLAQMTARIAARGGGAVPHIVHATEDVLTKAVTPVDAELLEPIVLRDARNWQYVIKAMEDTAHVPGGTAYRVGKDAPYRMAAKTGTAQVAALKQDEDKAPDLSKVPEHLRDHALFVAFAPVDAPRVAIAVLAEHAGHGGTAAAPIARQVMDQVLLGEVRYKPQPAAATVVEPEEAEVPPEGAAQPVPEAAPEPAPSEPPPPP